MRIKVLSFGKDSHPINNKSLDVLEDLAKKDRIFIESFKPKRRPFTSNTEFKRLYNTRRKRETVGILTDMEVFIHPKGLDLYATIKPLGFKSHLLVAAMGVYEEDLKIIPRANTILHNEKLYIDDVFGFDLLEEESDTQTLMKKWFEKNSPLLSEYN
jgi:hypothetical protein